MRIFLSHAAVDKDMAEFVEKQLRLTNPPPEVFRTTRVGQIPAGKEWLAFIQEHLRAADRYMVLLTPWSMSRPWISFETGAAWFSERTLVPVTAGGLAKADVVEPLKSLQLLSLEDPDEAEAAFTQLECRLGDPVAFCSAILSLGVQARSAALTKEGWIGVDYDDSFYAWDGPIEDLREGQPRPLPTPLIERLKERGLRRLGFPADLKGSMRRATRLSGS